MVGVCYLQLFLWFLLAVDSNGFGSKILFKTKSQTNGNGLKIRKKDRKNRTQQVVDG